jgi:ATP-binding cassette subfamily B protein RaxB
MPMKYNTLITDTGLSFSGGQKQRILLARALYKGPRILFLDEATSHLDAETENKINRVVSTLGIARIIVAHRKETILSCDHILVLDDGRLNRAAGESSRATESVP